MRLVIVLASTAFHLRTLAWGIHAGYGYQWWRDGFQVGQTTFPVIYALGYGGQFLWIVPNLELVVLVLHHNPTDAEAKHTITKKEVESIIIPAVVANTIIP